MILQSPHNCNFAEIAAEALNTTETGRKIIGQHPWATVTLMSEPLKPNYFQAIGGKNHTVHLSSQDKDGLSNYLANPATSEFAKSVSALAHELIHAIHSLDDHLEFKKRNQCDPINRSFGNQEEELTITGETSNSTKSSICENDIRRELMLPLRTSH